MPGKHGRDALHLVRSRSPHAADVRSCGYVATVRDGRVSVLSRCVPAVCAAAGVLCLLASVDALGTPYNQCDNMAGTCIRERQVAAIVGLQFLCVAGVIMSPVMAYIWRRWRTRGAWWLGAAVFVVCVAGGVFVLVADPINHLNNRWSGWLSD
jgi:hypothetical protein